MTDFSYRHIVTIPPGKDQSPSGIVYNYLTTIYHDGKLYVYEVPYNEREDFRLWAEDVFSNGGDPVRLVGCDGRYQIERWQGLEDLPEDEDELQAIIEKWQAENFKP